MHGSKLGFLSRSERVFFTNPSNNDAEGPSFYQTQFGKKPENFAPFGTTTSEIGLKSLSSLKMFLYVVSYFQNGKPKCRPTLHLHLEHMPQII